MADAAVTHSSIRAGEHDPRCLRAGVPRSRQRPARAAHGRVRRSLLRPGERSPGTVRNVSRPVRRAPAAALVLNHRRLLSSVAIYRPDQYLSNTPTASVRQLGTGAFDLDRYVAAGEHIAAGQAEDAGPCGARSRPVARRRARTPVARCPPSTARRRTWRSSRSSCTASPRRTSAAVRWARPSRQRQLRMPGHVAAADRVHPFGDEVPSPSTSSEPNGSLPPSRAARASSKQRRRCPMSTSFMAGR